MKKRKKLLYKLIYSPEFVELETLKTYIKTNLANSFILPFEFFVKSFILFIKKLDNSIYLYIYYQDFNNPTMNN